MNACLRHTGDSPDRHTGDSPDRHTGDSPDRHTGDSPAMSPIVIPATPPIVIPANAGIQSNNESPPAYDMPGQAPATRYQTGCRVKPGMTTGGQARHGDESSHCDDSLIWSLIWDTHKLEEPDFYDTIYGCPELNAELNDETLHCHD